MPVLPERTMSAYDRIAFSDARARSRPRPNGPLDIDRQPAAGLGRHARMARAGLARRAHLPIPYRPRSARRRRFSRATTAKPRRSISSEREYGLPPALSGHNQYWIWGTRGYNGNVIIDVHGECDRDARLFRDASRRIAISKPVGASVRERLPDIALRRNHDAARLGLAEAATL